MYEEFYGLHERPFDLSPNPRFLFLSPTQREALSTLVYAVTSARGLALLIGEAGMGKTTLVHTALAQLDNAHIECVLVSNPTLTREEFYEFLAEEFGFGPDAAESKSRFLFALRHHLETRHLAGHHTALLIDEAQSLPFDLLEEIRLLSNVETATAKLLTVVLAGQPELAERLNDVNLRQLKQRIAHRCEVKPFTHHETAAYIAGRLRIAGGTPVTIFTRDAVNTIFTASRGVPRVINVICENALIGGFAAQLKPVPRSIVEEVIRDFDLAAAAQSPTPARSPQPDTPSEDAAPPPTLAPVPSDPPVRESDTLRPVSAAQGGRKKWFSFF